MPTYEYCCTLCKHEWEVQQSIKDPPLDDCPRCAGKTAQRVISRGTGFVLKGGGWAQDRYSKPSGGSS